MRLTNEIRNDVVQAVLNKVVKPKIDEVKKELAEIAQETADSLYSKKTMGWISTAPSGGLHTLSGLQLGMDDKPFFHALVVDAARRRHSVYFSLNKPVKVLAKDHYSTVFPASKRNQRKLIRIKQRLDVIQAEQDEIRATLKAALSGCNTRKQLSERYPDLVQYLPKKEPATKSLMISNDDVMKVINIS